VNEARLFLDAKVWQDVDFLLGIKGLPEY